MTDRKPFLIMVKPNGSLCNMRCRYCYYIGNEVSERNIMRDEVLEAMIRNYFENAVSDTVSFVWHGGEPTLSGLDFYKKAVELQKKYLREGMQCWNNLQTNGLLLDEEWCAFLKEEHFDVGISVDGTRMIHDAYRKDAQGNLTYERIRKNFQLLQKYGVQPDLLCTVSEETTRDPYQVYNSLKHFRNGWIQFIPIVNHDENWNVDEYSVRPESYGRFLCEIFRLWLTHDFGRVNIQLFLELLNVCNGGTASLCNFSETCGRALVVESNGATYSCDHFVKEECYLGNVTANSFSDMAYGTKQEAFGRRKKDGLSEKCRNCPYLFFCHGECPKNRMEDGNNYLCEGLKMLYEYSEKPLQRVLELLKERKTADEIMRVIRKEKLLQEMGK